MTSTRPSRLGLFLPFIFLIVLIGLYVGYWTLVRNTFEKTLDEWIAAEQANGASVSYTTRRMTGFPFRVSAQFESPNYVAPGNVSYEGQNLELVMQPWNWQHIIARAPGISHMTGPNGIRNTLQLDETSAGSVSWGKTGLRRIGLQLNDAEAILGGQTYKAEGFSLNLSPRDGAPDDMMMALQWDQLDLDAPPVSAPFLGTRIGPSRLIGDVQNFYPAFARAKGDIGRIYSELLTGGGTIEIGQGLLDWGPLKLGTKGTLVLDNGLANGELGLRIDEAEGLKEAMQQSGQWELPQQLVVGALETASQDGGFLTLSVVDNQITLGGIRLGALPSSRP